MEDNTTDSQKKLASKILEVANRISEYGRHQQANCMILHPQIIDNTMQIHNCSREEAEDIITQLIGYQQFRYMEENSSK